MIDLSKTLYGVAAIAPSGQRFNLSYILRTLMWEEQKGELAVRLQADIDNSRVNGSWLHTQVPLGSWVYLYSHMSNGVQEVFRGRVLVHTPGEDPMVHFQLTAYDPLIHLMKSKDDRYYADGTNAKVILADIFNAWGIPVDRIDGPDVKLGKQVFRGSLLSDQVNSVIDQGQKLGAGKFIVKYVQGKVSVIAAGQNTQICHFGGDNVVTSVSDQWSIENLVTRVKVLGHENSDSRAPVVATVDGRTDFGVFQDIVYQSQYSTPAAANQAAKDIISQSGQPEKTRQLVSVDVPFIRRGDKVHISAGTLDGYYIVSWVQHDATTRTMTWGVDDL